jgi:hypothetical protein
MNYFYSDFASKTGGNLFLGGSDSNYFTGSFVYAPVIKNEFNKWFFKLSR